MKNKLEKGFTCWAKGNVFALRFAKYIQLLNLGMLTRLFVKSFESRAIGFAALFGGIIIFTIISLIDYRWVLGKEMGTIFEKNTEWKELKKDIKKIKEKLEIVE